MEVRVGTTAAAVTPKETLPLVPADVVTGIVYSVLLAALVIPTLGAVDRFFEPRLSL